MSIGAKDSRSAGGGRGRFPVARFRPTKGGNPVALATAAIRAEESWALTSVRCWPLASGPDCVHKVIHVNTHMRTKYEYKVMIFRLRRLCAQKVSSFGFKKMNAWCQRRLMAGLYGCVCVLHVKERYLKQQQAREVAHAMRIG